MSGLAYSPPREDIQNLASNGRDPQGPKYVRESAARVQRWLDGKDPYGVDDEDEDADDE